MELSPKKIIYRFSDFALNTFDRTLSKNGVQINIASKTFDVLRLLVEKSGETITKEELLSTIWSESFVEEGNLTVHISILRKKLGASKANPLIKTISGQGYQFVVPVETEKADQPDSKLKLAGQANLAAIKDLHSRSIAVLPLRNENGHEEVDYLADGITESLINSLSYMPDFRVIARDTVFRYKDKDVDVKEIGRTLGVAFVLTGRLRVVKDQLVIGVELVKASDCTQLWGKQINEPFTDIFEVQKKLTEGIANELAVQTRRRVPLTQSKKFTKNPASYRLYLKGKHHLKNKTSKNLHASIQCFRDSISIDPSNALSYVGAAESYFWLHSYVFAPRAEALPMIRNFLSRAKALNPHIAELHTVEGNAARNFHWDFTKALKCYERALAIEPNHFETLRSYSHLLSLIGDFENALSILNHLKTLSPMSALLSTSFGRYFYNNRMFDKALLKFKEALELEPDYFIAHFVLGLCQIELGRYDLAVKSIRRGLEVQQVVEAESLIAYAHARAGETTKARKLLADLEMVYESVHASKTHLGIIYCALNNPTKAFALLEQAFEEKDEALAALKVDPRWDPIRTDSRYEELLARVGLPVS